MSATKEVKLPITVLLDPQKDKVLFAEIDNDFADILLSFLTIPLGSLATLFEKHFGEKIGWLSALHNSLSELDDVYFCTPVAKDMLLNPRNTLGDECQKLKLNVDEYSQPIKYFSCSNSGCKYVNNVNVYDDDGKCKCGNWMDRIVPIGNPREKDPRVFTTTNFILTDDMQVMRDVLTTQIQILNDLGITDMEGLEQRKVYFGIDEVRNLLKAMLCSPTPLTDIILEKKLSTEFIIENKPQTADDGVAENNKAETYDRNQMVVKAVVQKSTNKLLFFEAGDNFVEFLFSFLTIPLGGVARLLGRHGLFGCLHNFYESICRLRSEYFRFSGALYGSWLPRMYLSKRQILPLAQGYSNLTYYHSDPLDFLSHDVEDGYRDRHEDAVVNDPKGRAGHYLRGPRMFVVTNELKVAPMSLSSTISFLRRARVPASDVEEVQFVIRKRKALEILKASLTSTALLTDVFEPDLRRRPEEERVA